MDVHFFGVLQNTCCTCIIYNIASLNCKQDKKPTRVRKPRGKQPDPEPVILTLSSDEEDSNSSMLSNQVRLFNFLPRVCKYNMPPILIIIANKT